MLKGLALLAAVFFLPILAEAGSITYNVIIDTSSISGTNGSLDFNFNPGPFITQAASIQLLNFASNGTLAGACPCESGDVSGQLPGTVTFDNGGAFNDYFDGFAFGSTLSFQVSLFGPALSAPDGTSTSGSVFAFSMFSDPAGTVPTLTTDATDGFAFLVNVNLDGTTTVTNFSDQSEIAPAGSSTVPEPSSIVLMIIGAMIIVAVGARAKSDCY